MNPEQLEQIRTRLIDVLMKEMDDISFDQAQQDGEPVAVIEETKTVPLDEAGGEVVDIISEASEETGLEGVEEPSGGPPAPVEGAEEEEEEEITPRRFGQFVRSKGR